MRSSVRIAINIPQFALNYLRMALTLGGGDMDRNRGKGSRETRIYPNAGGVIDMQVNHWTVGQSGRQIMRGKI